MQQAAAQVKERSSCGVWGEAPRAYEREELFRAKQPQSFKIVPFTSTCKAYEWGNDDETSWNIIDRDDNGDGGFSFQSTNCPHLFIYRNGENNVVIHENNGEWTWEDQIWYSIPNIFFHTMKMVSKVLDSDASVIRLI